MFALQGGQIEIVIFKRKQNQTVVGIQAPKAITILRKELQQETNKDEAA